jgi:hypothetical protein
VTDVALCIPFRTVNVNLPGESKPTGTFSVNTIPTALQVEDSIAFACESVMHSVKTLHTQVQDVAKCAAMWRAAADIELAYAERDADVNEAYVRLNERANAELEALIRVNAIWQNTEPVDPATLVPYWSFPDPTVHGDWSDL